MRPRLHRHQTNVRRAGYSLLIALFTLVAQGLGLGHMLLVSHTRCEHGAFVHESHSDEETDEARAKENAPRADARVSARPGANEGEHDHCNPFATAPALVTAPTAYQAVTLLDECVLPWSVRPSAAERAIGILSLAPKNSPPV